MSGFLLNSEFEIFNVKIKITMNTLYKRKVKNIHHCYLTPDIDESSEPVHHSTYGQDESYEEVLYSDTNFELVFGSLNIVK